MIHVTGIANTLILHGRMQKNDQNVFYIENGGHKAYYYSITTQLAKSFDFGLYLSAAYTHSKAKAYSDGIGDQVTSAYRTNTYSVGGINEHETGYGTYVSPSSHCGFGWISFRIC